MSNEIKEILYEHFNKYPKMKIQDMIKLIYQNEFAGGHLVKNEFESLKRLQAEMESIKSSIIDNSLFEDIGNGLVRLYFKKVLDMQIQAKTINRFFINTSNSVRGSVENFEDKVNVLRRCCEEGKLPFAIDEVDRNMQDMIDNGYHPISHSEEYRRAYNPCYRVVLSEYRTFFHFFLSVDKLLKSQETVIIAIDGNSGAGKSTLSKLIADTYDCNIFHTDDFFLTPELRTEERLKEPGGNVDYIRFRHEILDKIKERNVCKYSKYNCSKGILDKQVQISPKRLNIIEGCYSMHPYLINDYDLKVFLHVSKEKQKARILERNGALKLERFINEWIPLEDKYFKELQIPEKCDLIYKL